MGNVKIHMVTKIKILIIKIKKIMRNFKNLKNKANMMIHKIIKKILLHNHLKNKS